MSPEWHPDDSLLERDEKGEVAGARRVKDALQKHGVSFENRVVTSRDPGMDALRRDLARPAQPEGVERSQLPVTLGSREDVVCFETRMQPGAKVPEHRHGHSVFRFVISGSLKYRDSVLGPGDWMVVPPEQPYAIEAGPDGCVVFYAHSSPVPPAPGPGPGPTG